MRRGNQLRWPVRKRGSSNRPNIVGERNRCGATPVHRAAENGHKEVVELFARDYPKIVEEKDSDEELNDSDFP